MNEWRELITVDQFRTVLLISCVVWTFVCFAAGFIRRQRNLDMTWAKIIAWAVLGPLALGLYWFYEWTVRVNPHTGSVGLHKVSVFALDALIFIIIGIFTGWLFARLYRKV